MSNYSNRLEEFKKKNKDLFEKYPSLEYVFINIFNEGFSGGAEWMREMINK